MKARPGELNYASYGVGSSPHLAAELFQSLTGTTHRARALWAAARRPRSASSAMPCRCCSPASPRCSAWCAAAASRAIAIGVGAAAAAAARRADLQGKRRRLCDPAPGSASWRRRRRPTPSSRGSTPRSQDMLRDPAVHAKLTEQGAEVAGLGPAAFAEFLQGGNRALVERDPQRQYPARLNTNRRPTETLVNAQDKRLTGRIAPERIRLMTTPRPPAGAVERFKAIGDPTGVISDAMDELGIAARRDRRLGAQAHHRGHHHGGPGADAAQHPAARSIRSRARARASTAWRSSRRIISRRPGDVLVIRASPASPTWAASRPRPASARAKPAPSCMGGIRDIAHSRAVGYPLWSSEISPVTGKWRLETVEINGAIQIGEVRVEPGDLVVADDTGVCFIPRDRILEVLELAEKKAKAEDVRCKAIDGGIPVADISRSTYGEKDSRGEIRRRVGARDRAGRPQARRGQGPQDRHLQSRGRVLRHVGPLPAPGRPAVEGASHRLRVVARARRILLFAAGAR